VFFSATSSAEPDPATKALIIAVSQPERLLAQRIHLLSTDLTNDEMQGPNKTHAKPGVAVGQARVVQDKAREMGFSGSMSHAHRGDEASNGNEANRGNESNAGNNPNDGNEANSGNEANDGNVANSESATADQD